MKISLKKTSEKCQRSSIIQDGVKKLFSSSLKGRGRSGAFGNFSLISFFKLRQGASIRANVGRSVGRSVRGKFAGSKKSKCFVSF